MERERRTDLGERPIMKVVPVGRAGMWGNKVPECKLRWWYGPTKDGQTTNRHARRAAASRARRGLPCKALTSSSMAGVSRSSSRRSQ